GHDSWMTEYAYLRLLRYAAEQHDPERYLRLWEQARRWSEGHGENYFPFPRPAQDEALRACLEFRLRGPCEQLLAIFDQHRAPGTISPEVRQLDRPVLAPGQHAPPAGAEGDRPDERRVPQWPDLLARGRLPEVGRP